MLDKIRRIIRKVAPWKGGSYSCPGCGRLTIHTGTCPYCGASVK